MAQEDKGLVMRGLVLLAAIGSLVAFVLGMLFWRSHDAPPTLVTPPEHHLPSAIVPAVIAPYPSGISWYALSQLGETLPSAPGWEIRYNAAATLARKGSAAVPWPLIREMLDEKYQMRNYRVRLSDGRDVYDEAAARANMINALKALAAWHELKKDAKPVVPSELLEIYTMVDRLTQSPFGAMKIHAEKAQSLFFR